MEPTSEPKKLKNPKKVEAGRKSAEARRAKSEERILREEEIQQRLAQLEKLKTHIYRDTVDDGVPPGTTNTVPNEHTRSEGTETSPDSVTKEQSTRWRWTNYDLTPWIIGLIGLGAVVYQVARAAQPAIAMRIGYVQPKKVKQAVGVPSVSQALEPRPDPFHME